MNSNKFILNADDFGINQNINKGVLDGYNSGIINSTSLCANGECFDLAINDILPKCPNLCIGVHLNIIEGKALCPEKTPLLVDNYGNFNNSWTEILRKSFDKEFLRQVEIEFCTQIEKIKTYLKPAHIDSHVHTHGIPNLFELTCRLADKYNIPYVRTQYEKPYITPVLAKHLNLNYTINQIKVILLNTFSKMNKNTLKKYQNIKTNDYLVGVSYTGMMDDKTVKSGLNVFKNQENLLIESLIHPYFNEKQQEYNIGLNQEMKYWIEKNNFEFTTYKKIAELNYETV